MCEAAGVKPKGTVVALALKKIERDRVTNLRIQK
jgi:tRNA G46 methylase TrmB